MKTTHEMTLDELTAELASKCERRAELEKQVASATREAEETRRRLADDMGSVSDVTEAQQRAAALESARVDIASRIAALEAREAQMQQQARREERAAQLLALADHATTQYERIDELQRVAHDELLKTCQAILAERASLSATRKQFAETVGRLQELDGPRSPDHMLSYQERVEVAAARLLRESDVEIPDFEAVAPISMINVFPAMPTPLGLALDLAITSTWHFMERQKKSVQASGSS
jgi:cell division septum initiation protein DivIVA